MSISVIWAVAVILHVATAAAWFGIALRITAPVRLLATSSHEGAVHLASDGYRAARLMTIFGGITFFLGLAALFSGGGFSRYGAAYHTSILLMLVLIGIHYLFIHRSYARLSTAAYAGSVDPALVAGARKQIGMGAGIGHLLWFVILVLMFWNQVLGPAFQSS